MKAERKLMIGALVYSIIFSVAAFAVMFYHAVHKKIVILDVAQDEEAEASGQLMDSGQQELRMERIDEGTNRIYIPVPGQTRSENVLIENYYMNHELWVRVDTLSKEFLAANPVFADCPVLEGRVRFGEDGTWLQFTLESLCEYRSVLEKGYLAVELLEPKQVYERIVVIDPQGEENALEIARFLKEFLDASEIKAYYSRMEERELTQEERLDLMQHSQADLYIGIRMGEESDAERFGTAVWYGGRYFTPEIDSVRLADMLERQVVTRINGKALGIWEDTQDEVLGMVAMPAVVLSPGYLTNEQEREFLEQESYRRRIAEGIYQTILEAYEKMERSE